MDNSQFNPPQTKYNNEPLYKHVEQAPVKVTPEQINAPFQIFDNHESLVDSFRDTYVAIEQKNGRTVEFKYLPISFVRPARRVEEIQAELIDKERAVGGQLFAEKNKYYFWYGGKSYENGQNKVVGNWYLQEIASKDSGADFVTHIETSPQDVKKFNYAGQLVPVTLSDLEVLIPAVHYYVREVMELYPAEMLRKDVILDELDFDISNISVLLPPKRPNAQKTDYDLAA